MKRITAVLTGLTIAAAVALAQAPAASATVSPTKNSVFVDYPNAGGGVSIRTNGTWRTVPRGQTTASNSLSDAVSVPPGCRIDVVRYFKGTGTPYRSTLYDRPSVRVIFKADSYYRITTVC